MDFLDLSAASEEERRLINEILSDTSVVKSERSQQNVSANGPTTNNKECHQITFNEDATSTTSTTVGAQTAAQTTAIPAQLPRIAAGDMNSVISMDMATTQAPGYAIPPPPPHTVGFAPHVYGGPPIFQPYPYLIPYNLPYMPYVLPTNPVIPTRQQQHHPHHHHHQQQHQQQQPQRVQHHQPQHHHHQIQHHQHHQQQQQHHHHHHHHHQQQQQQQAQKAQQQSNNPPTQNAGNNTTIGSPSNMRPTTQSTNNHTQNHSQYQNKSRYDHTNNINNIETHQQQHNPEHQTQNVGQNQASSSVKIARKISISATTNKDVRPPSEIDKQSKFDHSSTSDETKLAPVNNVDVETQRSRHIKNSEEHRTDQVQSNEPPADGETKKTNDAGQNWSTSVATKSSWADLFKRNGGGIEHIENGVTDRDHSASDNVDDDIKGFRMTKANNSVNKTVGVRIASTSVEDGSQDKRALDKMALRLAQKISSMNLKHSLPFLKPRGFLNKGNGCYINATLQALVACPPFYNLMKEIGDLRGFRRDNTCTPILDSFAELFLNFPPLDSSKQKNKLTSNTNDYKMSINNLQADAIEPKCIYNVLGQIKSECLEGAQEDAEEFLSSVLNGLHDEMICLGELTQTHNLNAQNGSVSDFEDSNDDVANDDNLWREVGQKNRSLPIRTAKVINTPIQEIFGGSLFSIRTAGKDRCGHRSPFFDLQLDISNENVKSVQDAIKSFTATEVIHDFYCSKTKQTLDAQRRTSLDQLPPILILHLKQFVYTQDHGLKKLIKKVEYPIDFELPECCLHEKNYSDKNLRTSRTYKLLAVVYHEGREAVKGHYLTDVYHIGSSQWIRCDDSNLKVIPSPRIENPESTRTPYLLFYRRLNTLRAQTGYHDTNSSVNKKKS